MPFRTVSRSQGLLASRQKPFSRSLRDSRLSVASSFGTAVGPFVLARLHIDSSAASTLLSTATSASDLVMAGPKTIGVGQWVSDLLLANPVKAAADGAMLQLIVFAPLVGVAVGRIEESGRQPLMRVVRVVYEAALTLVGWVLVAAPVGPNCDQRHRRHGGGDDPGAIRACLTTFEAVGSRPQALTRPSEGCLRP